MFYTLITQPILNILLGFYSLTGDFGIAIILFALFVKLAMWKLTKNQYKQTLLMQKLQPKIKEIKRKAAGNKQLEMLMTMNLYKTNGVKMSGNLISMLITLPIFIVMYTVVRWMVQDPNTVNNRAYEVVKNMDNVKEIIANPQEFKPKLFHTVDLTGRAFDPKGGTNSLILLAFVIGATVIQYLLINQTTPTAVDETGKKRRIRDILSEAAEGKEADQSEINQLMMGKMNKFMPIMLFFTFGNIYGALGFYSFVNGLFTYIQNKLVRNIYKDELEAEIKEPEIKQRERNAQEAEIVSTVRGKKSTKKSGSVNITRIKAKK